VVSGKLGDTNRADFGEGVLARQDAISSTSLAQTSTTERSSVADLPSDLKRSELLRFAEGKVSRLEFWQMRAIRRTLVPGFIDSMLRWFQRTVGQLWITVATSRLHHIHHIERLQPLAPKSSFILVSNHRSFFDLYILTAALLRWGLRQRIVFPVRANFFYDTITGFFVNGVMSFFAMYPPLFRDKKRAALNALGLDELASLLREGETLVGIHPEGRRNTDQSPYDLLPAKSGVGRLIHSARGIPVIPVFTNGLLPNNLRRQVVSNFDGTGIPIHSVFGNPIDFGDLLAEPASPRLYAKLSELCLEEVRKLGQEEKAIRAAAGHQTGSPLPPSADAQSSS
jgi:1-acyl-sn-glycerol-3-phosphate acyltransferase